MLNRDVFKKQVGKLVIEYSDRGFTMSKERAEQWYEHMSECEDSVFEKSIDIYLTENSYIPSMSDILKIITTANKTKAKPLVYVNRGTLGVDF